MARVTQADTYGEQLRRAAVEAVPAAARVYRGGPAPDAQRTVAAGAEVAVGVTPHRAATLVATP
ncbi:MAG: hypothetical protein ACRDRI_26640 [Pseudonocardiaceae bacterium]